MPLWTRPASEEYSAGNQARGKTLPKIACLHAVYEGAARHGDAGQGVEHVAQYFLIYDHVGCLPGCVSRAGARPSRWGSARPLSLDGPSGREQIGPPPGCLHVGKALPGGRRRPATRSAPPRGWARRRGAGPDRRFTDVVQCMSTGEDGLEEHLAVGAGASQAGSVGRAGRRPTVKKVRQLSAPVWSASYRPDRHPRRLRNNWPRQGSAAVDPSAITRPTRNRELVPQKVGILPWA